MTGTVVLGVLAAVLLVLGVCCLLFATHVGKAGQPMWVVAGAVLILGAVALGVWAGLAAQGVAPVLTVTLPWKELAR